MKKNIHPQYHSEAKIICACGNIIEVGSTIAEMKVEVCGACHPLYTGKKKATSIAGRVDRFKKMAEKAAEKKLSTPTKKERPVKTKAEIKKVISKKKKK